MAKLATLKPSISALPHRLSSAYQRRDTLVKSRGWYRIKRWYDLRKQIFARDHYRCRMCGLQHSGDPADGNMVCDHIIPHRGNQRLMWDPENLQTLCAYPCHNSLKQKQEHGQW